MRWGYDKDRHVYINLDSGKVIGPATLIAMRDQFLMSQQKELQDLANFLIEGRTPLPNWVMFKRQILKEVYLAEYIIGRGGRHAMTQRDWGIIGNMLRKQYEYLQRFAERIRDDLVTPRQITAVTGMYIDSARHAFERARTEELGMPVLPAYPGDGGTKCLTRCQCHWMIEETETEWNCYWIVDVAAESCPDCIQRGATWSPLVIPKMTA